MKKLLEIIQTIPPPIRMLIISGAGIYLAHHGLTTAEVDQMMRLIAQFFG